MQLILPVTVFCRWYAGRPCQTNTFGPHELKRREVLSSFLPEGARVRCVRGLLWITRDGDADDILLHAGGSLVCERRDRLVIEALEDAVVEFTARVI
ncbi:MAG: DUF2917 domain-containing protein [Luteolibacter sp.]